VELSNDRNLFPKETIHLLIYPS